MGKSARLKYLNLSLILAVLSDFQTSCNTWLENGPENKAIIEGQRTSFICDLNDNNSRSVFWTHINVSGHRRYISYNYYIYPLPERNLTYYEVIIDISKQTYELVLKAPIILTDSGVYECGCMKCPIVLASANLTILPQNFSHSCELRKLPARETNPYQEFELLCAWSHSKVLTAHFESVDGQITEADVKFPHRIISRFLSPTVRDFICSISLNKNVSPITTPCSKGSGDESNDSGIVRVDPFISKITTGSNASFTCSLAIGSHRSYLSWNLTDTYETQALHTKERVVEKSNVLTILNVSAADESLLIGCRVSLPGNGVVSSFSALRVVETTTIWDTRFSDGTRGDQTSTADQATWTTTSQDDQEFHLTTRTVVNNVVVQSKTWIIHTITTSIVAFLALLSVTILGVRQSRLIRRRNESPNTTLHQIQNVRRIPLCDKTSTVTHQLSLPISDDSLKYHEIGTITVENQVNLEMSGRNAFQNGDSVSLGSRGTEGFRVPDTLVVEKYNIAMVTTHNELEKKESHAYSKKIFKSNEDISSPCALKLAHEDIPLKGSIAPDGFRSEKFASPELFHLKSFFETNLGSRTEFKGEVFQYQNNPTYETIPDNVDFGQEVDKCNKNEKEQQFEGYLVPIENPNVNINADSQEIVSDSPLKKSIAVQTVRDSRSSITKCNIPKYIEVNSAPSLPRATVSLLDPKCDIKSPQCSILDAPSEFGEDPSELDIALDLQIDDPFFNLKPELKFEQPHTSE